MSLFIFIVFNCVGVIFGVFVVECCGFRFGVACVFGGVVGVIVVVIVVVFVCCCFVFCVFL